MKRWFLAALVLIPAFAGAVACDNGGSSSISPTAPQQTESFSGTVAVGGIDAQGFTVSQTGPITVVLTAAGPPSTIFMALGLGVGGSGSSCVVTATSGNPALVQAGQQISFSAVNPGGYCYEVIDVGNASTAISYTVTIAHS
jgi:hypothetical protein